MLATRFYRMVNPVRYASNPQTQRNFIMAALRGYDVPQFLNPHHPYPHINLNPLEQSAASDMHETGDPGALMAFLDLMHDRGDDHQPFLPNRPLSYESGGTVPKQNALLGVLRHILTASQGDAPLQQLLQHSQHFDNLLRTPGPTFPNRYFNSGGGFPQHQGSPLNRIDAWLRGMGGVEIGTSHPHIGAAVHELRQGDPMAASRLYDAVRQPGAPQSAFYPREESSGLLHQLLHPTIHQAGQGG